VYSGGGGDAKLIAGAHLTKLPVFCIVCGEWLLMMDFYGLKFNANRNQTPSC
jgi:hypothetical protein